MKFRNFVLGTISSTLGAGTNEIRLLVEAPYRPPPDPGGEIARMIIADSLRNPSTFEIVTYTGIDDLGNDIYMLTGVTRGTQGTTAQAWPIGSIIRQDVTAADLRLLELQELESVWASSVDTSVRRIDGSGHPAWVNVTSDDAVMALRVDLGGNCYFGAYGGQVGKLNPSGGIVWIVTLDDKYEVVAMDWAPPNNLIVMARLQGELQPSRAIIIDAENGAQAPLNTPLISGASLAAVGASSGGLFLVLYQRFLSADSVYIFDRSGNRLFDHQLLDRSSFAAFVSRDKFVFCYRLNSSTPEQVRVYRINGSLVGSASSIINPASVLGLDGMLYQYPRGVETDQYGFVDLDAITWSGLTTAPVSFTRILSVTSDGVIYVSNGNVLTAFKGSTVLWQFSGFLAPVVALSPRPLTPSVVAKFGPAGPRLDFVAEDDVSSLGHSYQLIDIEAGTEPDTPPTDHVWLYVEAGELKAKFDNGFVATIASDS